MQDLNLSLIVRATDRVSRPVKQMQQRFNRSLSSMRESMDRFHRSMERAANISLAAQGVQSFATQARTALAAPVQAAMDFESAMADVSKVVDFEGADGAERLGNELERLSTRIPVAATGLADIAAAGGELGIAADDLPDYTETVAKMATAFDMVPDRAGEAMAKLSNIFGIPIQELQGLGDAVNHLSNNMAAKADEIVAATKRVGGSAKQFGLSAQQTSALTGSLIALGKQPEVAATSIKAMLTRLQAADTQKFQGALDELGISAQQVQQSIANDAQGGLMAFLERLEGLDSQARTSVIARMFGQEHVDKVSALVGSLDKYRGALGMVSEESAYAGSMQAEFEARASTAANAIQLLQNMVSRASRALGDALLPSIKELAPQVSQVVDRITGWIKAHPELTKGIMMTAGALTAVATVAAPVLMGLAGLTVAAGGVSAAFGVVSSLLGALPGGLGALAGGLRTATVGAQGLAGVVSSRMTNALRSLAVRLYLAVGATSAWARANWRSAFSLRALAAGAASRAMAGLRGIVGALRAATLGARAFTVALLTNPITWIGVAIAGVAALIYRYWEPIKAFFSGFFAGLSQALAPLASQFRAALGPVASFFQPVLRALGSLWSWLRSLITPIESTGGAAQSLGRQVGAAVGGMVRAIVGALGYLLSLPGKIFDAVSGAVQKVGQALSGLNPLQLLKQAFTGALQWLGGSLPAKFAAMGQDILSGLVGGFTERIGAVKEKIQSVAEGVKGWFADKLGISSPSKVMAEAGGEVSAGVAVGMEKGARRVRQAAAGVSAAAMVAAPAAAEVPSPAIQTPAPVQVPAPSVEAATPSPVRVPSPAVQAPAPAPVAAPSAAGPAAGGQGGEAVTIHAPITIHATEGMDERAVAEEVRRELDAAGQSARARRRGALYDG